MEFLLYKIDPLAAAAFAVMAFIYIAKTFNSMSYDSPPLPDWWNTIPVLHRNHWQGADASAQGWWSMYYVRQMIAFEDLSVSVRASEDCS